MTLKTHPHAGWHAAALEQAADRAEHDLMEYTLQ